MTITAEELKELGQLSCNLKIAATEYHEHKQDVIRFQEVRYKLDCALKDYQVKLVQHGDQLVNAALQSITPPADLEGNRLNVYGAEDGGWEVNYEPDGEYVRYSDIAPLLSELARLRVNDARYRFLRENFYYTFVEGHMEVNGMPADIEKTVDGDEMDAAIDAQLNKDTKR